MSRRSVRKLAPRPEASPYYTTAEAAAYLRRTTTTLRKWRVAGTGPQYSRPEGSQPTYRREDLDEWVAGGLRSSTTDRAEDRPEAGPTH